MTSNRIKSIDFLKGLAIILVVWGHAIQCIHPRAGEDAVFNLIYSFHMPLFIFLSGSVSYKVCHRISNIKKRAYQLLIPFFVYPVVTGILLHGGFAVQRWIEILKTPDRGLWFLYILFFITSFFVLINLLNSKLGGGEKRLQLLYIICAIIAFVLFSTVAIYLRKISGGREDYGTSLFARHTIYFLLGLLSRAYIGKIKTFLIRTWYVYIPIWFILALFWRSQNRPTFIENPNLVVDVLYYYISGVAGIIMMFSICLRFIKQNTENHLVGFVSYLGTITLGIYAIHASIVMRLVCDFFMSLNINYSVTVLLAFVSSMFLCILIINVIERCNILPQLLLGKVRYK